MLSTTATTYSDDENMQQMFCKVFRRVSAQSSNLLDGWVKTALKLNHVSGRAEVKSDINYRNFGRAMTVMRVIFDVFGEVVFRNGCSATEDAMSAEIEYRLTQRIDCIAPGFDFVFAQALSEEKYESQVTGGLRMIICPRGLSDGYLRERGATLFETDSRTELSLANVHAIRKLLSMAKEPTALIARGDENGYLSIGIGPRKELNALPYIDFGERAVWSFCTGRGNQEFRYERGRLGLPQISLDQAIKAWTDRHNLSAHRSNIENIVSVIRKQKHGTGAIIADTGTIKSEVDRLANMNRAYRLDPLVNICDNKSVDKILSMTAPDGALMLSFDGICHAFGVILDGRAISKGNISRGARYNSFKDYLCLLNQDKKLAVGVIVSEDGMIDLLSG